MTTAPAAVAHVRAVLSTLNTDHDRAVFLKELTHLFSNHATLCARGIEGPDGLTPEQRGLRPVVAQVEHHWRNTTPASAAVVPVTPPDPGQRP